MTGLQYSLVNWSAF